MEALSVEEKRQYFLSAATTLAVVAATTAGHQKTRLVLVSRPGLREQRKYCSLEIAVRLAFVSQYLLPGFSDFSWSQGI